MLELSKRRQSEYSVQSIIKDVKDNMRFLKNPEKPDAGEVLTFMLDGGEYVIYKYHDVTPRNFIQRINTLWVYPLFVLSIPFQFILQGSIGVNRNSKIGQILDFLVKFEK